MPSVFYVYFPILSLILGLLLGSFYNVCVHRFFTGESIVHPRSKCPKCGHALDWWENIPLLSFALLKGKCRGCAEKISWRYPIVELISGLWALAVAYKFGFSWPWLVFIVFGGIFIVASFIDLEEFILPDMLTLPGAALAVPASIFFLKTPWHECLLGAVIGAGSFYLLQKAYFLLKKIEGLGTGDIKLMLLIGALVGWRGLPLSIFLGALTGLIASLFYLKKQGQGMKTAIPFGPFLSLGTMLYILIGPELMAWVFGRHLF